MTCQSNDFDPALYKRTQQESWNDRAESWVRGVDDFNRWNAPATEMMFALARLAPGQRVLDIATGSGEPGLSAASIVAPGGSVLGVDQAEEMVHHARAESRRHGLGNFEARVMDGERLELPDGEFDVVLCRFGLFFMPDQIGALREWRRVLKPVGRLVLTSYLSPETHWRAIPTDIIRARGELAPQSADEPGAYNLADGGAERMFTEVGFSSWEVHTVHAPCQFDSLGDCLAHMQRDGSVFVRSMAQINESKHESIWNEIQGALRRFDGPHGFEAVCDVVVAMAER